MSFEKPEYTKARLYIKTKDPQYAPKTSSEFAAIKSVMGGRRMAESAKRRHEKFLAARKENGQ